MKKNLSNITKQMCCFFKNPKIKIINKQISKIIKSIFEKKITK